RYSLWHFFREIPPGWTFIGLRHKKKEHLGWVGVNWTDRRPKVGWLQRSLLLGFLCSLRAMSVLVVISMAPALTGQTLLQVPGAEIVSLTTDTSRFSEPSIAVNPIPPHQIVVVFEANAHAFYSQDAGRSWKAADGIASPSYKHSGDVSVAFDNRGHAYIAYVGFDKLGTFNYWGHNTSRNGLFVQRTVDGGVTWEQPPSIVAEHANGPGIPLEDKPYIVSDTSNSRFAGNLYLGWTRWTLTDSRILLSRSTDGGQTWSPPVEIDNHPGLPRDDNGENDGFAGVVGPDGSLYAIWSQENGIFLTISRDGGKTFSRARQILRTAPLGFNLQTVDGANGFPQIAIDPRSQRLYVTWSDYRNGDVDVFCSTSTDGGKKWSAPIRVNDDPVHNGADQFYQWLAVDPVSGAANVIFYDRRSDPENRLQTITLARSTDGGRTFQNYAWTNSSFDATGVFLGDYTGLAAFGGRVYGAWTETIVPAAKTRNKIGDQDATGAEKEEKPVRPTTVIKVGVADFNVSRVGELKGAQK
ncbi:MAG TPA: hypothetical protein VHW72_14695, partial [Candidatus Angelobacter sp.]|nr:hypothetical protein [Candidatus Angelobacter sp.]